MFMMCKLFFLHDVVVHVCGSPMQVLPIDDNETKSNIRLYEVCYQILRIMVYRFVN